MPLVTIHTSSEDQNNSLAKILDELRNSVAQQLSGKSRKLNLNEISVRVIKSSLWHTIADIEIVIIAHAYSERIENQDKICLAIKEFVKDHCPPFTVYVWLQLSELGHSA